MRLQFCRFFRIMIYSVFLCLSGLSCGIHSNEKRTVLQSSFHFTVFNFRALIAKKSKERLVCYAGQNKFLERRHSMESIYEVARFFLSQDPMSHKKLQKLCYYAQAWYLANYDRVLFPSRYEAWIHGPVSPDLYNHYREWGWEKIAKNVQPLYFKDSGNIAFLQRVYGVYGSYCADELERIACSEGPWKNARRGCSPLEYSRNPILLDDMRNYYGRRLVKRK